MAVVPLIGIILILLAKNQEREIALFTSLLTLVESIRV
jgi:hypothetical protein